MKTTLPPEQKKKAAGKDAPIQSGSLGDIMFERIWALLIEDQQKKERYLDQIEKRFFRQIEENNRQLEESGNKFIRRMEEKRNEYIEDLDISEIINSINSKIGLKKKKIIKGDSFTELYKNLIRTSIISKFDEMGYHFDDISLGRHIIDKKKNKRTEIDIILENKDCITAVKIITKPGSKNVNLLSSQLKILKSHRSKYNDKRKIYGAIAGAAVEKEEKQAALNAGIFVFEQDGITMKAGISQNFVPHEW
ncbi:MAG: hypothetical protein LBC76_02760 [Treponema sp.]|jgi:hypothetical protein|nr:hypothetical protein [Treponema sp.]